MSCSEPDVGGWVGACVGVQVIHFTWNRLVVGRLRKIKMQHQRLQGQLQGLREVMERYVGNLQCAVDGWAGGRMGAQGPKVVQDMGQAASDAAAMWEAIRVAWVTCGVLWVGRWVSWWGCKIKT